MGSAGRIASVAALATRERGNIVVLSAMSGTTNSLVEISEYLYKGNVPGAQETLNALETKYRAVVDELFCGDSTAFVRLEPSFRLIRAFFCEPFGESAEKEILAQGELMSTALMQECMSRRGIAVGMLPALDYMRTLDNGEPDMAHIGTRLRRLLADNPGCDVYLTQGYICRNSHGGIGNLKRGGSDYTASLIGAVTDAEEIQIWTDIDGMHNNDPRYVEGTYPIRHMSFNEAAELAYFGAKILHPSTIQPCREHDIAVKLKNTLDPAAEGTTITASGDSSKKYHAVAAKDDITVVRICSARMLLAYGFLRRVFEIFEKYRTPIDMITTSEVAVSLTIDDNTHVEAIVEELSELGNASYERGNSIICVVGKIEHETPGLVADILDSIRDIPVKMVSYGASSRSVAILINSGDKISALRKLNDHLFANV